MNTPKNPADEKANKIPTDRELLELAALAAGLKNHAHTSLGMQELAVHGVPNCGFQGPIWNPRDDDGDSRRLEVAAGICAYADEWEVDAYPLADHDHGPCHTETFAEHGGDKLKAHRMAVLRCAAGIGRAMKGGT